MPVSIVVGGQFGSEGKGKVAHYLARKPDVSIAVRCGGTNSGHTVIDENGVAQVFRQLPTAAILPGVDLALCAGSYIDLDVFYEELHRVNVDKSRIIIDPFSVIITEEHRRMELSSGLTGEIGSTGSGTGAAVISRLKRKDTLFAKDVPALSAYIRPVNDELRSRLERKHRIVIEGTQGFGLSPFHSGLNPFVTSRDTTAAAFLAEAGLSPFDVDEIALVIRALPIRVGGNSGPLANEIDWKTVSLEQGEGKTFCEYTSVTKSIRRVGRFDPLIVKRAIVANRPTAIYLNHIDYMHDCTLTSKKFYSFRKAIESSLKAKINYAGFGKSSVELL